MVSSIQSELGLDIRVMVTTFWPPRIFVSEMAPMDSTNTNKDPIITPGMESGRFDLLEDLPTAGTEIEGGFAHFDPAPF